jgi:peptidylprolyl isomerase
MATWSDGREKDSSYDRRRTFAFGVGGQQVIEGFDRAVTGMREGGRRRVIVPPGLAYGAEGSPPAVGPDETLVFVIDLVRVCRGRARAACG